MFLSDTARNGMSYIEIVVIIGIMGVVSFVSTPFMTNYLLRNHVVNATELVLNVVRKGQLYAINKKNNSVWGVCKNGNVIRLYTGSCNNPSFHEDSSLPGGVMIQGFSSITFSALRGEPSSELTITISSGVKNNTIRLNKVGGIDVN